MAYLTDHDSVTNKFSVGKVDIVGHEPNYTPDNDGKTNNIVPTQVIKKDPQIEKLEKMMLMYIWMFLSRLQR